MQISTTTKESSMEIPQKAKDKPAIWSSNTAPTYLPKRTSAGYSRDNYTPMFISTLFSIAVLWKPPIYATTDEWIMKL
jgi:hypothetical protein